MATMDSLSQWYISQGGDYVIAKEKYPDFPWYTWHLSVSAHVKAILMHNLDADRN